MKETRDPAIKLFGKEIALPEKVWTPVVSGKVEESGRYDHTRSSLMSTNLEGKKLRRTEETEQKHDEKDEEPEALKDSLGGEDSANQETHPDSENNPETPPINEENGSSKPPESENNPNSSDQKTLKKPDKILPCPRCNSMDTKFCYYNNYNVNQPRHFCKSCQRYWTAGGSMRNVPVGAGRRKNKSSSSHCRQITISEALQGVPSGIHHPGLKVNGTVLSFGPEAPLCESMASGLKLAEKAAAPNGFYGEVKDDCSSGGSSVTSSNSVRARNRVPEPIMTNLNGFPSQIPCPPPGVPWPYPWNSVVPVPAYPPSGYPMPFYPVPYWNCSVPGGWNVPWVSPSSPSTNQNSPNSPTLGKHSRDGELLKLNDPERNVVEQRNPENSIVIPKTLRIDDPDEAARSSIWSTLGIRNESIGRKGLFKGFQPKSHEKNHIPETQSALCANPAAMSRSFNFQETA